MSAVVVTFYIFIVLHSTLAFKYDPLYDFSCNPMEYGAIGDGIHDDTKSIQAAMDACYHNNGSSGVVYLLSNKIFLSYSLNITSKHNCTLIIEQNSTLLISDNISNWNTQSGEAFLRLHSVNIFNLFGGGLINGQGQKWWDAYSKNNELKRPYVVWATNTCSNFFISNITVINQPYHTFEMYSNYNEFSFVTVIAPGNTDETDAVDARGNYYYIHDCYFSEGDDNVAVMGNHTLVQNCYFGTGHGASIGSLKTDYNAVYCKNITFENITFNGTANGCRIKAWPGQPYGNVTNVIYRHLAMYNVQNAIILTQYYNEKDNVTNSNLYFDDIHFENITSINTTSPGYFHCQPSSPCYNIFMDNVNVQCNDENKCEFDCEYISGNSTNVRPTCCFY